MIILYSFPGRGNRIDCFRVPTVICYNGDGSVRACGAEAEILEADVDNDFELIDMDDAPQTEEKLTFLRWYVI